MTTHTQAPRGDAEAFSTLFALQTASLSRTRAAHSKLAKGQWHDAHVLLDEACGLVATLIAALAEVKP